MAWYPGKIFHDKLIKPDDGTNEKKDSETETTKPSESEGKEEREIEKSEQGMRSLLYLARSKYIEYGLEGTIEFYYTFTAFTSSISCDVAIDSENVIEDSDVNSDSKRESLSVMQRMIVPAIDAGISKLLLRARGWRTSNIIDHVTLSDGFSVSTPIYNVLSLSINMSATAKSLTAYLDKDSKLGNLPVLKK
jgi:hypothetical protein